MTATARALLTLAGLLGIWTPGQAQGAPSAAPRRSPCVSATVVGRSTQGRPLWLITAARPEVLARGAPRVLVICGQHGNEPIAPRAARDIVRRLARHAAASPSAARPDDPAAEAILSRVVTLVLPCVNPDGAARRRRANAAGVDLNRDWQARTQPETRAVFDVFTHWQPQLVVDAHEWLPGDTHTTSSVELPLTTDSPAQQALARWSSQAVARCRQQGIYVQRTHWAPANDPRLAHRYFFAAWQVPALLYEISPAGLAPDATRLAAATCFLWELLGAFAASAPTPPPPPLATPTPTPRPAAPPAPILLAAGALLLWLLLSSYPPAGVLPRPEQAEGRRHGRHLDAPVRLRPTRQRRQSRPSPTARRGAAR